jgi:hypothetical protein
MRVLPCGVLLPLLSTMFSCTPGVGLEMSAPPVVTCMSWNMSKS